jgi:hypothetical protein
MQQIRRSLTLCNFIKIHRILTASQLKKQRTKGATDCKLEIILLGKLSLLLLLLIFLLLLLLLLFLPLLLLLLFLLLLLLFLLCFGLSRS